jgi:hypothetical protein
MRGATDVRGCLLRSHGGRQCKARAVIDGAGIRLISRKLCVGASRTRRVDAKLAPEPTVRPQLLPCVDVASAVLCAGPPSEPDGGPEIIL